MKFSFGGLVLIVFGVLVLARNLGFLNISIAELIGNGNARRVYQRG